MNKLLLLVLLASLTLSAQERVDLTTPETKPSNPNYRIARIVLDSDAGVIDLTLIGVNGELKICIYSPTTNPTGAALLTGLNKANLSSAYAANATTGSLKQRIFHRLVVMNEAVTVCGGSLVGTLTGSVP